MPALILLLLAASGAPAQTPLPLVEEIEWMPFRDHCRQLLRTLDEVRSPLPAETAREVAKLLERRPTDADALSVAVQKRLDAHCLIAVSINPESRVKAARGPALPRLQRDRPTVVLIKVQNDGGVTHALRMRGQELIRPGKPEKERWLKAELLTSVSFPAELTGRRLEYRLLRLTPQQSGKREATFQFDVGQGTQDLGFRAEVPILFTVGKAERRTSPR